MSEKTILPALLDYYSDKSSASASMVVATIFGLFATLTLLNESGHHPLMFWLYWVLWIAGLYFLMRFRFWSLHAVWTLNMLRALPLITLEPGEDIIKKIEKKVLNEWEKTLVGWFFVSFVNRGLLLLPSKFSWKKAGVRFKLFFKAEKTKLIKLGDVVQTVFYAFGCVVSIIFFPETLSPKQWWEWVQLIVFFVLLFVFVPDAISVHRHGRWRKKKRKAKTSSLSTSY